MREALPLVSFHSTLASAAVRIKCVVSTGLILRGRRTAALSRTSGQLPTALGRVSGITKKAMSRYSSITAPWIGVGSGICKAALGIRKLVCVQMQVLQCLAVIATRGTQKPSPERAQVIPSRAQVLMMVIRNEPQLTQAELRNDTRDLVRHRKQRGGKARVLPGGVPSHHEGIPHQLNRALARKQAHRASGSALPRGVALRSLPPRLVPEVDVREQKRTSTRLPAATRTQSYPKIPVDPHRGRQGARLAFSDHFRRLINEPLVEFVYELETGAARPGWEHE